jgi:hypothetical protein
MKGTRNGWLHNLAPDEDTTNLHGETMESAKMNGEVLAVSGRRGKNRYHNWRGRATTAKLAN